MPETTLIKPIQQPFCTTQKAAEMLGISKRTAQLWVENGLLTAWKTSGGHRRITLESVERLISRPRVPDDTASSPAAPSLREAAPTASSPFLLVVEDDPVFQELYASLLPRWSMKPRVHIAAHGYEALIRTGMERPDLLITDLDMPHMNGFQMLRAIKDIPELAALAIIVVTGLSPAEIDHAGGLPPDIPILHKPIRFERLEYLAATALALRTRRLETHS